MEQSESRKKILAKIVELEKSQKFNDDVEDDPETIVLMPNMVDYLNKKLSSKINTAIANRAATKYFEGLIKDKQLIIEDVQGIENFTNVKSGAIITCNHFNPCDNYAVWRVIKPYMGRKRLWKVIREGNYTNFPGFYGYIFKNCNTLPLSSNVDTMKNFLSAVNTLLTRGEKILIYPEQAMWWNYKKPRPLKMGAYKFAVTSNVPVIPMFITMSDSDVLDPDGYFVQKYVVHILPPIYPKPELSHKENMQYMRDENYRLWVETYENTYKCKLKYEE